MRDFPGCSVTKTLCFLRKGAQVQALVGEPRTHMLRCSGKKSQMKKYKFGENSSIYDMFLIFKEHLQITGKETNPG